MKASVSNLAAPNALRVHVNGSITPTHLLHGFLSEIPIGVQARLQNTRWRSLKELREDAHWYGLSLYKLNKGAATHA